MSRPPLEVADIVRCAGQAFLEHSRKWINWQHQKVLLAITRCRTAALGGHRDQCSDCGHTAISYNSCRNRHCPRCQGNARLRWLKAREQELLPTRYVHAVFTLPRELAPLALQNKRLIYNLLFHASAETLLEIARDPRHLGAEIGFFSVLHSWNQRLAVSSPCPLRAGRRWSGAGSLPLDLRPALLLSAYRRAQPCLPRQVRRRTSQRLPSRPAPVPRQPPAHGRAARLCSMAAGTVPPRLGCLLQAALRRAGTCAALSRRLHPSRRHLQRQAGRSLREQRDLPMARLRPRQQEEVHDSDVEEFLRRFLLHLLPRGFVRIRNFGFLANRQRAILLPLCFQLLGSENITASPASPPADQPQSLWNCPVCGATMHVVERLTAAQLLLRSPPQPDQRAA